MDRRKKLTSLAAIVGSVLLLALLASLASITWATPTQNGPSDDTIPDKLCTDTMVARGKSTQFTIMVNHPMSPTDTWYDTYLTDTIDANLRVMGIGTSRGYATWTGQDVTFTLGTMYPGDEATLTIDVTVRDDAPQGYVVSNTAHLKHVGWDTINSTDPPPTGTPASPWMFDVSYEQMLPLTMRNYR
jgi:fimbrial isopeptide formation D2 family protein